MSSRATHAAEADRARRPSHADLDLALAAQLQKALLPATCPADCPNQRVAARNRMCQTIGGDFYDFIRANDDQVAVVVGDVVGHGVRSSLLMAQIMGFLRSMPPERRTRPIVVATGLNRLLIDLGEQIGSVLPCSMFYAVFDTPSGVTFFVNAGHPRPLLCDRDKLLALPLGPRNLVLGVEEFEPEEDCITFEPGQRLVLYTDGIADAHNADDGRFGESRLAEAVARHAAATADECADGVFRAVHEFRGHAPQTDDETIVVIDRV